MWRQTGMIQAHGDSALYSIPFTINVLGQGLTAHCHFPDAKQAPLRAGDPIEFVRPDKSTLSTKVRAISMVKDARPGLLIGLVLPDEVDRDEIPLGTMLRLVRSGSADRN